MCNINFTHVKFYMKQASIRFESYEILFCILNLFDKNVEFIEFTWCKRNPHLHV